MPYRRRSFAKRKKPYRRYKRFPKRRRGMRKSGNNTFSLRAFVSAAAGSDLTPSTINTTTQSSIIFRLSDIANDAEYTAIFDQYKLVKVVVKFIPLSALVSSNALAIDNGTTTDYFQASQRGLGFICSAYDLNDANTATTAALREYRCYKQTEAGHPHIRTIYPKAAAVVYDGATAAYSESRGWVSTSYPDTQHYALKYNIVGTDGHTSPLWRIESVYYVRFRNVR